MKKLSIYMLFLKFLVLIFTIKEFLNLNYKIGLLYLITLIFFILSYFLKNKFNLKYIYFFENIIYLLLFSYEFNLLYKNIPLWDTIMHALTSFLLVIFVYLIFYTLKKINKVKKIYPILVFILGFCFSITISTLFEIMEYSFDKLKGLDMQKDMIVNNIKTVKLSKNEDDLMEFYNIEKTIIYYKENDNLKEFVIKNGYLDIGINDTMKDLYVALIGALMGSFYVYLCLKEKNNFKN